MTTAKPWHRSRTIWAALLVVVSTALHLIAGDSLAEMNVDEIAVSIVTLVAGLAAIYGRLKATERIEQSSHVTANGNPRADHPAAS